VTKSLSNLYKRNNVVSQKERIIDYNDVIKSKIGVLIELAVKDKVTTGGFISGLHAEVVEPLYGRDIDALTSDNENSQQQITKADLEASAAQAESVIDKANIESDNILDEAHNKADIIKKEAYSEGKEKGLEDARIEIDHQISKCQKEHEQIKTELQQQYDDMKSKMEPELVGVITDVFKKVINIISDNNEEIILDLVNSVMHNTEVSREFVIKVSPDDYKFLVNNQGKIYCAMSKEVQIEIVEDLSMTKNQCVIESDVGVYDCSLDIQLSNLIKDIKLLSCI